MTADLAPANAGDIFTVAGNGSTGLTGDGGPATSASVGIPTDVTFGSDGSLEVLQGFFDFAHRGIRSVDPLGQISTVSGSTDMVSSPEYFSSSPDGGYYYEDGFSLGRLAGGTNKIARGCCFQGEIAGGVLVDGAGDVYAAGGDGMFELKPDGSFTNLLDGTVCAMAFDSVGDIIYAGYGVSDLNKTCTGIGRLSLDDQVTQLGANVGLGLDGVAVDNFGNIFASDIQLNTIDELPSGGSEQQVAGDGTSGFLGDGGPAADAELNEPTGLTIDSAGDLYVADLGNNRVREIVGISGPAILRPPSGPQFQAQPTATPDYVALGDSFSSGEGAPPFDPTTDSGGDNCHRNAIAYPNEIARLTGLPLSFYACSGAKTSHILTDSLNNEKPELSHSDTENANTSLVTVTVGGDDAGFKSVLEYCIALNLVSIHNFPFGGDPSCVDDPGFLNPVQDAITSLENNNTACSDALTNILCDTFQTIASHAPNASVIAADYPALFSSNPSSQGCISSLMTSDDESQLNGFAFLLDAEEQQAAAKAGINFLDVAPYFQGHGLCDSDSFINGLNVSVINGPNVTIADSFHPNAEGQSAYAQAFEDFLNGRVAASTSVKPAALAAKPHSVETANVSASAQAPASPPFTVGDLTVTPLAAQQSSTCADSLQPGQQVEVQGKGYQPNAQVRVALTSPGPNSATAANGFQTPAASLTADATGSIDSIVTVPFGATGFAIPGQGNLAFLTAKGVASNPKVQTQDDLADFTTVGPGDPCALAFPPASATIHLTGNDTPFLPLTGAAFEITGPGLPSPTTAVPGSGTFAELDANADGTLACAPSEPTGVTCNAGVLEDLAAGSTYSASQVQTPAGYLTPATQSFAAALDGSTTTVSFADNFASGNFTTGAGAQNCTLCILNGAGTALSATGSSRITWSGTATNDSTSPSATAESGSAALSGQALFTAGGVTRTGSSTLHTSSPIALGTAKDPFPWFTYPTSTAKASAVSVTGSSSKTLQPGVYSTISIAGSASVSMAPGVYIVTGSVSVAGSAKLTGSGVTIDLECPSFPARCATGSAGASLSASGTAQFTMTGGATGPGQGFTLLGDRNTANGISVSGSATLRLTGSVYAPLASITLAGLAPVSLTSGELVAGQLSTSGSSTLTVSNP